MEDEALDLVFKVPISDAPDCAVQTYGFLDFLRAWFPPNFSIELFDKQVIFYADCQAF